MHTTVYTCNLKIICPTFSVPQNLWWAVTARINSNLIFPFLSRQVLHGTVLLFQLPWDFRPLLHLPAYVSFDSFLRFWLFLCTENVIYWESFSPAPWGKITSMDYFNIMLLHLLSCLKITFRGQELDKEEEVRPQSRVSWFTVQLKSWNHSNNIFPFHYFQLFSHEKNTSGTNDMAMIYSNVPVGNDSELAWNDLEFLKRNGLQILIKSLASLVLSWYD